MAIDWKQANEEKSVNARVQRTCCAQMDSRRASDTDSSLAQREEGVHEFSSSLGAGWHRSGMDEGLGGHTQIDRPGEGGGGGGNTGPK